MNFTKNFTELNKGDSGIAGGKGASLGEMTQAGIPVPPGFVVLSDSFERFIEETDLVAEIDSILHSVNNKEIHTVENASEKIRALILNVEMPKDIADEISKSFKELNTKYVAVRSSATAEDGKDHAWAGQLESYLNTTEEDVLTKVKLCWSSLFTPRAIFYRFEKGLHDTKISVAVVVQKMVESEVSGIAFSVHPVTEDYNQLIIEAGFGLGEAIVSGSVTPDSYVVEKNPRNILDINISTQTRALHRAEKASAEHGNNEWVNIPEPKASSQVLNKEQILELSEIILKIENHYGFPCDIEWAFETGKFYIVQSRPITTLAHKKITKQFKSPELQDFDTNGYDFDGKWKNDLFATCFWQDCWVPDLVKDLDLDLPGVGAMNLQGGHYLVEKKLRARMNMQIEEKIKNKDSDFFKNLVRVSNDVFNWGVQRGEKIRTMDPTLENFEYFVETANKINFLWLIGATYTNWPVEKNLQDAVVESNFPAEHVMEIVPKIDTPLHHYQSGLVNFKKHIGTKSFEEVKKDKDLFLKLQKHAETYVWVETFNFIGEPMTTERVYEQIMHLDDKAQAGHKVYHPEKPLSDNLKFALECMHDVGYVKQGGAEYFSIFSERIIPFLNKVAYKIGVTYREFMCLSTYDIRRALNGEVTAETLKSLSAKRIGVNNWALIPGRDGKLIFIEDFDDVNLLVEKMIPRTDDNTTELKGQIGNKGKYTGVARVVMNTYDFDKVLPGDVLVTTMTTPDFIVLMQKSGAIVTDIGGLLCHAAIVSRELNKPCVIGTKFATQILKDGDQVEVDADNGVVRIVKKNFKLDPSDYVRMFAGKSFPYLFSNVFLEYYKSLGVVSIQGEGSWMSFFPKSNIDKTKKEGSDLYTNLEKYTEYRTAFDDYIVKSSQYFESVLKKSVISKEDVEEFFEHVTKLFKYYSKTEFFYTDGVDQSKMIISVKEFDELKLGGRSYLNKIFFESDGYIKSLVKKVSRQTTASESDLLNYSVEEISDLVENGQALESKSIKERDTFFESKDLVLFGSEAESLISDFFSNYLEISNVIKGTIANKGKARGLARVLVPDAKDFEKISRAVNEMNKGEILIAETTSPDIIMACKKASAIVTNQGGQLSHAAIVSRELGIPCIIGTDKDVILNIKTGDMVEVDAENGIVRIL